MTPNEHARRGHHLQGRPRLTANLSLAADTWLFALAALGDAMIGTIVGVRWMSQTATRHVLAAI